jgi:transcription elongation factor Elf1
MRTHVVPGVSSLFASMAPACPTCNELMIVKTAKPLTLMYGHQLDQYTFECGNCGYLTTRTFDEDEDQP